METQLIEAPGSEEVRNYKMLVGGEWVDALSGKAFESINPYTGRAWATAPEAPAKRISTGPSKPPARPSMKGLGAR
jgi:hypothetical protein